jgi:hypothetical protein
VKLLLFYLIDYYLTFIKATFIIKMQDRYISLDPENADQTSAQVRSELYSSRLVEAAGGDVAQLVGTQVGITAAVVSFAGMRSSGFKMLPFCAKKSPKYAAIAFAGILGYTFGSTFVFTQLGDPNQYKYLLANKSGIMRGEKSLN